MQAERAGRAQGNGRGQAQRGQRTVELAETLGCTISWVLRSERAAEKAHGIIIARSQKVITFTFSQNQLLSHRLH